MKDTLNIDIGITLSYTFCIQEGIPI